MVAGGQRLHALGEISRAQPVRDPDIEARRLLAEEANKIKRKIARHFNIKWLGFMETETASGCGSVSGLQHTSKIQPNATFPTISFVRKR